MVGFDSKSATILEKSNRNGIFREQMASKVPFISLFLFLWQIFTPSIVRCTVYGIARALFCRFFAIILCFPKITSVSFLEKHVIHGISERQIVLPVIRQ